MLDSPTATLPSLLSPPAGQDGNGRFPPDTGDERDRLGMVGLVVRNVGGQNRVQPKTRTAAQESGEAREDKDDIPKGGLSHRDLPKRPRRLPKTPVPKVASRFEGENLERTARVEVERLDEKNTAVRTRPETSKDGANQKFEAQRGPTEDRTREGIRAPRPYNHPEDDSKERERVGKEHFEEGNIGARPEALNDGAHQKSGVQRGLMGRQTRDDIPRATTHPTSENHPQGDIDPFSLSADSSSCAEAIGIAKTLNANIFQVAALIADSLECAPVEHIDCGGLAGEHLRLGQSLMERLPFADPGIVQIALQGAIARWCKKNIDSWCIGDERFGNQLTGLYEKILHSESSRAARRWRAITRAQTKNSDEDIVLASSLVETVFDVMVSAGWKMRDYPSSSRAFIRNQFDPQITAIVKYSLQLRATIGEEIVSEDLEVAYVEPNHIFDKQSMEDTDAVPGRVEGRGRMRDLVVCTTDIGIQKRENRCDSEPEEKRLLLCPKVVLQSTLHESQ